MSDTFELAKEIWANCMGRSSSKPAQDRDPLRNDELTRIKSPFLGRNGDTPPVSPAPVNVPLQAPTKPTEPLDLEGVEFTPDQWRSVVGSWPIPRRERWGKLANRYEDEGIDWKSAEMQAFIDTATEYYKP